MEFEDILYEAKDGIAKTTINRPKRHNAFRSKTLDEMTSAFELVEEDGGMGVVILTGAGDPMGPLQVADLLGLDILLHIMDVLYEEFRDSKYRACPLLRKMVAAGRLGKKTGQGFYKYT